MEKKLSIQIKNKWLNWKKNKTLTKEKMKKKYKNQN